MNVNADTRVECLERGDRFRWLGEWYEVDSVPSAALLPNRQTALRVTAEKPEERHVFLFPTGFMVEAVCCPRSEL